MIITFKYNDNLKTNLRRQGAQLMFLELRDGTGFLQAVLTGQLCQSYDALILQPESSVSLFGTLVPVKEGQKAEGGHELQVDYWELVQCAPPGKLKRIILVMLTKHIQVESKMY